MGKGKFKHEQAMENALEKAAYKHLQYLQNPNYAAWWAAPESWDWDDYQAWQGPTHPAPARSLGKAKAGERLPKA